MDPQILSMARNAATRIDFSELSKNRSFTPNVSVGGSAVSGPSFVDNDGYRGHIFQEFGAKYTDREAGAAAHIAYQYNVPFIFFHTMSTTAGSGDRVPDNLADLAAENTLAVLSALLREPLATDAPTAAPSKPPDTSQSAFRPVLLGSSIVALSTVLLL